MEKIVSLKTNDGKKLRCITNISSKENKSVVVFIHGLTGHPNEHTFYNAAQTFPKKGVDVFRPALYWWDDGNRMLHECGLKTHSEDLNRVLRYLKPKYEHIHLVGHSCGSPTILGSNFKAASTITLWDPSYLKNGIKKHLKEVSVGKKQYWLSEDQIGYLLSKRFVDEWEWFDGVNELEIVKNIEVPLHVITAGKGGLKGAKSYSEISAGPAKYTEIKGATHCFDEAGAEKELLKETLAWIKKYSK
jgi:hypothetical protein